MQMIYDFFNSPLTAVHGWFWAVVFGTLLFRYGRKS